MRRTGRLTASTAVALSLCALVSACAALPDPAVRRQHADALAAGQGWQPLELAAGRFALRAYLSPVSAAGATLTLYIEGDGRAWITPTRPSEDPTPVDPLALRLALAQPEGAVAYLGRPCQYLSAPGCQVGDWTHGRFSAEVVSASLQAVDQLKARTGAVRLVLVGYSGGAAIAALVAARRDDVVGLVTVAGNLDHALWTRLHHVTPLSASLDPADVSAALAAVPQWHWVGGRDQVVPEQVVRAFTGRQGGQAAARVTVVPDADHRCCWAERWPELWSRTQAQGPALNR